MKNVISTSCILLVCIFALAIISSFKNWEKRDRVIEWDIHGYYGYLPAKFIFNDIKLEKSNYQFESDYNLFWFISVGEGKNALHKTMGLAILYSPFFFAGNIVAGWIDFPQNGFSEPYKFFLLLSAVFYLFMGLEFVRKTLLDLNFSDINTGITLIILGIGTNLLAYASQSAPMMHVYNFFLIAVFVYGTLKWFEKPHWKYSILIGASAGMISLIYVPNLTVIAFFILTGITKLKDTIKLNEFYRVYLKNFLLILLTVLIVWIPQFVYWKVVTGKFIFNLPQDGQFYFNNSKIIDGLISWRKGWLIYTPLMLFAIAGIFLLRGKLKFLKLPILAFMLLNLYVVFSWWNWWYGGSIGQRPLIDSYSIMALPLAAFVQFVSTKKNILKVGLIGLSVFFIWLNIFQTFQYERNSLHYEGMTKELYFKQFGKLDPIKDFDKYIQYPNNKDAKAGTR